MTFENDPNRQLGSNPYAGPPSDSGWGVPIAIAVIALAVGGLLFYNMGGERSMTTASTDRPAVTQPAPKITPAPAPAPTRPAAPNPQ